MELVVYQIMNSSALVVVYFQITNFLLKFHLAAAAACFQIRCFQTASFHLVLIDYFQTGSLFAVRMLRGETMNSPAAVVKLVAKLQPQTNHLKAEL